MLVCPKCGKHIKFYDNIPLLSYIILGGKCRYCKEPISCQYPIVEFLTGLLTLLFVWHWGLTAWTGVLLVALYSLIILSVIDLELMIIPDRFSLGLLVLGLALLITCQALLHIMVTVNLIPETGQTLPLISRGGSSVLFTTIALGMILSVSRQNDEQSHDRPKNETLYEKG